jgi:hypothetical protein
MKLLDDVDHRIPMVAARALGLHRDPSLLPELKRRREQAVNTMIRADLDRAILDILGGLPERK